MRKFPTELLNPAGGRLFGAAAGACIEIKLESFNVEGLDEPIDTSIRLEEITLPYLVPSQLSGQTLTFPTNPAPGYIDGSVYIEHAHHPVDLTVIRFGTCNGDSIEVEVELSLVFEFEGLSDFANTDWKCKTTLEIGALQ